jgi:hypothetical protein
VAVAIVEKLQEVTPGGGVEGGQSPVVEDQQVGLGIAGHEFGESAIGVGQSQFLQQPGQAQIAGGVALAAGLVGQGAANPGLADAGGAEDRHVEAFADPVSAGQLGDESLVQTARGAVVEVFQASALPEAGLTQAGVQAPVLARGHLPVGEQSEPFFEARFVDARQAELFAQCLVHAGQAQLLELVQGWVVQHGRFSCVGLMSGVQR